jgi:Arc/MetJ-type ribon-helix-helix transcriptional regulator
MARKPKEMAAVRLDPGDRRKIKALADRLQVNESDVIRYAIKQALDDLAALTDRAKHGSELFPAFIEHGPDKARYLGVDADKLDDILHSQLQSEVQRVPRTEMDMVLTGMPSQSSVEWYAAVTKGETKPMANHLTPWSYLREKYIFVPELVRQYAVFETTQRID